MNTGKLQKNTLENYVFLLHADYSGKKQEAAIPKRDGGTLFMEKDIAQAPQKAQRTHVAFRTAGRKLWKYRAYYVLMLPAVIYVAIFCYVPMYGLQIAFKDYRPVLGYLGSPWVGLKHFVSFFQGAYFWMLLRNTLALTLYSLIAGFPIPIVLALLLNEVNQKFRKVSQTILYAPHFISVVVLVGIMKLVFSPSIGLVNNALELLGMERIYFMVSPSAFPHLYVWSGIWQEMGWSAVIYIAALAGVDPGLHEAARIDGASRMQRILHINLPAILPTIMILLIMWIGSLVSVGYEKIYLMQNDLNIQVSEVISTYVYKRGIINTNYSFSTAVGIFNNVVNIILLVLANAFSKKVSETGLF